jgi:hypothetical protein
MVLPSFLRGPDRVLATYVLMSVPFIGAAALATPAGAIWAIATGATGTAASFAICHWPDLRREGNFLRALGLFALGVALVAGVGAALLRSSGVLAMALTFVASMVTGYVVFPLGSRLWLFSALRKARRRQRASRRH